MEKAFTSLHKGLSLHKKVIFMSKNTTKNGRYYQENGRIIYELTRGSGRIVTLTYPTGCPARDEKLARCLASVRQPARDKIKIEVK